MRRESDGGKGFSHFFAHDDLQPEYFRFESYEYMSTIHKLPLDALQLWLSYSLGDG